METVQQPAQVSGEGKSSPSPSPSPAATTTNSYGRRLLFLVGGAIVFIVITLVLGLGLGLGLRKDHDHSAATTSPSLAPSSPAPSSSPADVPSGATENLQSWRLDTSQYNLSMDWDLNAPPTTRIFNLTISEIQAAPDGELPHNPALPHRVDI